MRMNICCMHNPLLVCVYFQQAIWPLLGVWRSSCCYLIWQHIPRTMLYDYLHRADDSKWNGIWYSIGRCLSHAYLLCWKPSSIYLSAYSMIHGSQGSHILNTELIKVGESRLSFIWVDLDFVCRIWLRYVLLEMILKLEMYIRKYMFKWNRPKNMTRICVSVVKLFEISQ